MSASWPQAATYVQMARGMRLRGGRLTLLELNPATVFVRPDLEVALGHLPTAEFLDRWPAPVDAEDDATEDGIPRPPVGVLSLLDAGARMSGDAVLLLNRPRITADGLEYEVDVLRGNLPSTSGACVLFINPPGAPQTPARRWLSGRARR